MRDVGTEDQPNGSLTPPGPGMSNSSDEVGLNVPISPAIKTLNIPLKTKYADSANESGRYPDENAKADVDGSPIGYVKANFAIPERILIGLTQ